MICRSVKILTGCQEMQKARIKWDHTAICALHQELHSGTIETHLPASSVMTLITDTCDLHFLFFLKRLFERGRKEMQTVITLKVIHYPCVMLMDAAVTHPGTGKWCWQMGFIRWFLRKRSHTLTVNINL